MHYLLEHRSRRRSATLQWFSGRILDVAVSSLWSLSVMLLFILFPLRLSCAFCIYYKMHLHGLCLQTAAWTSVVVDTASSSSPTQLTSFPKADATGLSQRTKQAEFDENKTKGS